MFTGIVKARCRVADVQVGAEGLRLYMDLGPILADVGAGDLEIGESIAISGCCLTLTEVSEFIGRFDVITETLSKTTLDTVQPFDERNVERALRLSDRLGGHLVSGHIDGVGEVIDIAERGEERCFTFSAPENVASLVVDRGSISVDGVSLTVAERSDTGFRVALIPHTLEITTLGRLGLGDRVNLEADVLTKWVAELLSRGRVELPRTLSEVARGASDTDRARPSQ